MTESSYRVLCQEVPKRRRCNSKRSIVWGFGGFLVCLFGEKILTVSGKNYHIIFFAATVDVIVLYQIQVSFYFFITEIIIRNSVINLCHSESKPNISNFVRLRFLSNKA